jgi:fructokinase
MKLFGGIETGGTKTVCMVASDPDHIFAEERIPTTSPEETIGKVVNFFKPFTDQKRILAIGIASFGPVDLDNSSPTYGFVTTTPKPGWKNVNLLGQIKQAFELPIAFDTDVNAAATGEQYWQQGIDKLDPFIYITIGTGIGVGVIINGAPLHGLMHAEAGHTMIPHDIQKDPFIGSCPNHGDCFEGLASGPAMKARWGQAAETLPLEHPGWELEADYIAIAIVNYIYSYSPRQIVLGGGVALHPGLLENVRKKIPPYNHGYIQSIMLEEKIDDYIRAPILDKRSGALGAIAMAKKLLD